ncbi:MAG: ribosome biogenesis GTPase Der [Proteobacteria bacterium]|nr:MAG: ribosome biogenesis GTPase Der [Pseudomonadota bacterium]
MPAGRAFAVLPEKCIVHRHILPKLESIRKQALESGVISCSFRRNPMTEKQDSTPKKKSMISMVGRPNVGKSSLFNALLRKKQAIVMDFEGVTRDRRFATATVEALNDRKVKVCDTGGWMPESWRRGREDQEMLHNIEIQILKAFEESAVIVLVMDIRLGPTSLDEDIVRYIRKLNMPFVIAANKADKFNETYQMHEFYRLGAEDVIPVSAEHRQGIEEFWHRIEKYLPDEEEVIPELPTYRIAIVGRPNVGKSSFLNLMAGEERSVASALAGTTTDSVDIELERCGVKFRLVDTAGIRRHAKRKDDVEDLSVMYAKRNLDDADLAFLMVDTKEGITSQDSRIAKMVEESGCACIVLANKWDLAPQDIKSASADATRKFRESLEKDWPFLEFAPLVAISAERGKVYGATPGQDAIDPEGPWRLPDRIEDLWNFALDMLEARNKEVPADELKKVVEEAFDVGPNWVDQLGDFRRIHQVGTRPPQFLIHVRNANDIPEALRRYLKRVIRERYGYRGNPIRWVFKHNGER